MKFKKSISFALTLCMVLSLFATFVIPVAAAELPEGATGLDIYGYTHTHKNYVMYVDADMTLGELTAKYYGSSKDLNYFKVIVVNEDYTVAATYLDIDRNTNPASVKTDIAVTKGQVVLALSANEANVGRFEVAETVEVGDIVTLYNVDLAAENNTELTDAGFTVKAAPVTSKVVTDWNPVSYKESVGGATGAFIYDDADIYANCGNYWWIHAAFAPSATVEGGYEVVALRPSSGDTVPFLTIPENGFVWMAWSSAGDTPDSSGAYALAFMSELAVGDVVFFKGVDFANKTTAADATAELWVDPNAPVNVALNKDYTLSGEENGTYNAKLTDGNAYGAMTYDNRWFAFTGANTVDKIGTVVVDLGALYDITAIQVNLVNDTGAGVAVPEYANLYVSEDGETWSEAIALTVSDANQVAYWAKAEELAVSAQYVKFEVKLGGTFAFLNEIEVYGALPAAPEAGAVLPEGLSICGGSYGTFDVLFDDYTGVGEMTAYGGHEGKMYAISNGGLEAANYSINIVLDKETAFNTIALYGLDNEGGGVFIPEAVTFVINGTEYEAVVTKNANGIGTMVAELDEAVSTSVIVIEVAMGASPYSFGIFNMFTEFAISLVEVEEDDESYKDTYTHVDGVNVGTIQQLGDAWADKLTLDFWYLVEEDDATVTVSVVADDKVVLENDTQLRVWVDADMSDKTRTTLFDVKVIDGVATVVRADNYDAAVKSVSYEVIGKDYKLVLVLDKAALTIDGEYGLNVQLGQSNSTTMHSIKYDNVTGEGATYAPWTTTEFYEVFGKAPEAPVTSQVVTDWNVSDWSTSANGANGAYLFTDQDAYLACTHTWWSHISFKPTTIAGVYEVAAIRGATGEAASFEIAEGGFVLAAHDTAAAGTAGAYVHALIKSLVVGDRVIFNGLNIADLTTTADATAVLVPTAEDMDLLVSHNYNYNWHCFEGQIITMAVGEANLKKAGDAPNMSAEDTDILYIVELVDGAYKVTGVVGGKALVDVEIPENGFLYYVTKNCTGYDKICHGELVGKYLVLGEIDLATKFAIDTQAGSPAKVMKAVSGFKTGDADLDGKITATDYAIVRKLVLGTLTAEDVGELAYKAADVNGNGKVDARDYYLVKRAFLGTYVIPGWEEVAE